MPSTKKFCILVISLLMHAPLAIEVLMLHLNKLRVWMASLPIRRYTVADTCNLYTNLVLMLLAEVTSIASIKR